MKTEAAKLRVKSKIASKDGCVVTLEVEVPAGTVQSQGERVFAELQASLNAVWNAPELKINKVLAFFRTRFGLAAPRSP